MISQNFILKFETLLENTTDKFDIGVIMGQI